jgi:hypothetical protein
LLQNDLVGSEKLLARLDKACRFGCEEFLDLKESFQKYKAKKALNFIAVLKFKTDTDAA